MRELEPRDWDRVLRPLKENWRRDPPPSSAVPPEIDRLVRALETIAVQLVELRQCIDGWLTKMRGYLPWVIIWLLIALSNLDEGTRKTLREIWGRLHL